MTEMVTRYEFAELARRMDMMDRRIETIDQGGTRGMAVVAVQIQELTKDFARHELVHERERSSRLNQRRWLAGIFVAAVAAVDGPVVTVLLATHGGH